MALVVANDAKALRGDGWDHRAVGPVPRAASAKSGASPQRGQLARRERNAKEGGELLGLAIEVAREGLEEADVCAVPKRVSERRGIAVPGVVIAVRPIAASLFFRS